MTTDDSTCTYALCPVGCGRPLPDMDLCSAVQSGTASASERFCWGDPECTSIASFRRSAASASRLREALVLAKRDIAMFANARESLERHSLVASSIARIDAALTVANDDLAAQGSTTWTNGAGKKWPWWATPLPLNDPHSTNDADLRYELDVSDDAMDVAFLPGWAYQPGEGFTSEATRAAAWRLHAEIIRRSERDTRSSTRSSPPPRVSARWNTYADGSPMPPIACGACKNGSAPGPTHATRCPHWLAESAVHDERPVEPTLADCTCYRSDARVRQPCPYHDGVGNAVGLVVHPLVEAASQGERETTAVCLRRLAIEITTHPHIEVFDADDPPTAVSDWLEARANDLVSLAAPAPAPPLRDETVPPPGWDLLAAAPGERPAEPPDLFTSAEMRSEMRRSKYCTGATRMLIDDIETLLQASPGERPADDRVVMAERACISAALRYEAAQHRGAGDLLGVRNRAASPGERVPGGPPRGRSLRDETVSPPGWHWLVEDTDVEGGWTENDKMCERDENVVPIAEAWDIYDAEHTAAPSPGPTGEVERLLTDLRSAWVVKHLPTDTWWRPGACGYTNDLGAAGITDEETAREWESRRSKHPVRGREDKAMPITEAWAGADASTIFGRLASLSDEQLLTGPIELARSELDTAGLDPDEVGRRGAEVARSAIGAIQTPSPEELPATPDSSGEDLCRQCRHKRDVHSGERGACTLTWTCTCSGFWEPRKAGISHAFGCTLDFNHDGDCAVRVGLDPKDNRSIVYASVGRPADLPSTIEGTPDWSKIEDPRLRQLCEEWFALCKRFFATNTTEPA